MSLTKLSLGGNISCMTSLFPPRKSLVLVSYIPAGDGNIEKLFYGVPPEGPVRVASTELAPADLQG
jgi:hypothetical protein